MIDFDAMRPYCGFERIGFSKTTYKNFDYAVSLVFRLSSAIVGEIIDAPTYQYFQHYRTVNAAIDRAVYLICCEIEREGFSAMPVAASQTVGGHETMAGLASHKIAAVNAGLGVIGRNALFIAHGIGPSVRLGTIFTDMPFEVENVASKGCSGCGKCAHNCPANAIYNIDFDPENPTQDLVDRRACSEYMKKNWQHIGRGSVCGICMACCPQK